jgi:hypothetical protein
MPMLVVIVTAGVTTLDRLLVNAKVGVVQFKCVHNRFPFSPGQGGHERWLRNFAIE